MPNKIALNESSRRQNLQKFGLMKFQTLSLAGRSGVVSWNSRQSVRILCHYRQAKTAHFISEYPHSIFSMTYTFSLFNLSPSTSPGNVNVRSPDDPFGTKTTREKFSDIYVTRDSCITRLCTILVPIKTQIFHIRGK